MEWDSDSPCHSHTHPRKGCRSPGRCITWELEFQDCGAISGQRLLLSGQSDWGDVREEIVVGNACGGKLPWAAMEARQYCWVTCSGGAITIASLSPYASIRSWKIERLAHQTPDALNYRVGPPPTAQGGSLSDWCAKLQSRTPHEVPL